MIVSGLTTVGLAAANHVVEVHKPCQDTYKEQHPMAVKNVLEEEPNQQEVVQHNPVPVNILKSKNKIIDTLRRNLQN